jgi:hypothetical protein
MSAKLVVRHSVADYSKWRKVYDEVADLRTKHGCTGDWVLQLPSNPNEVMAIHDFSTVAQAEAFAGDPGLKDAMARGGVSGAPRIEIFKEA